MESMARTAPDDEPAVEDFDLLTVLSAVADPVRLQIITTLSATDAPIRCGDFGLPVSNSTATHHFTLLRQAGVLHQFYVGTARMNVLRADDLDTAFPHLLSSVVSGAKSSGAPADA